MSNDGIINFKLCVFGSKYVHLFLVIPFMCTFSGLHVGPRKLIIIVIVYIWMCMFRNYAIERYLIVSSCELMYSESAYLSWLLKRHWAYIRGERFDVTPGAVITPWFYAYGPMPPAPGLPHVELHVLLITKVTRKCKIKYTQTNWK